MGREQDGLAGPARLRQELGHEIPARERVEARHRLVEDQQVRARRERAHDRELLALSLRELSDLLLPVDVPVGEQARDQGVVPARVERTGEGEVAADLHPRKQVEALRHVADAVQALAAELGHRRAQHPDVAAVDRGDAEQAADQGGLAGAVPPEQAHDAPRRHVPVEPAQHLDLAEALFQAAHAERELGLGRRRRRRRSGGGAGRRRRGFEVLVHGRPGVGTMHHN